jgi:transposase
LEPLLPPRKPHPHGGHEPGRSNRAATDAILFVFRTGCQWNALNATGICSSGSAHRWAQAWCNTGVFEEFWRFGLLAVDALDGIDWTWLAMDGAITNALLGGKKPTPILPIEAKAAWNAAC